MDHEPPRLIDWRLYDSPLHRQVQANCPHLIACAVDNQRRQAVAHCLAVATRYGDAVGVLICIAQLNGPCVLPPAMPDQS